MNFFFFLHKPLKKFTFVNSFNQYMLSVYSVPGLSIYQWDKGPSLEKLSGEETVNNKHSVFLKQWHV